MSSLRAIKRRADKSRHRFSDRRCPDYFAGCIVCDYWRFKDETGRFPYSFDELTQWQFENGIVDESASALKEMEL